MTKNKSSRTPNAREPNNRDLRSKSSSPAMDDVELAGLTKERKSIINFVLGKLEKQKTEFTEILAEKERRILELER